MHGASAIAAVLLAMASPASPAPAPVPAADPGRLLIIGGGLRDERGEIMNGLRAHMPRPGGTIAIIPSASAEASLAAQAMAARLRAAGFANAQIVTVHIAMADDPASADVDEAAWAGNADNAEEIAKIAGADAIWFTGGDQLRTLRLLLRPGGGDTPMLAAIRRRLAAGAVIAGTSAGAAIMGDMMIICGSPDLAATAPVGRDPAICDAPEDRPLPLILGRGLGFLPGAVVDQHFGQRNRWPRLLRAMACRDPDIAHGFGIDEDTALLISPASGAAQIIGTGGVALIKAGGGGGCDPFRIDQQILSYRRAGDAFRITSPTD